MKLDAKDGDGLNWLRIGSNGRIFSTLQCTLMSPKFNKFASSNFRESTTLSSSSAATAAAVVVM
jgi:hypothetical protein